MGNDSKNFYESIKEGKTGEKIFENDFLIPFARSIKSRYSDIHLKNETLNKKTDYAIIIDSKKITFEVKSNYKNINNLIIETISVEHTDKDLSKYDKKGWIYTSTANIIVFLNPNNHNMLFFDMRDLKNQFNNIEKEYNVYRNKSSSYQGNSEWYGYFKIIPLQILKNYKEYSINNQNNVFEWIISKYINKESFISIYY